MGDYVNVKCRACETEVAEEYREDLKEELTTYIPECNECYEKGLCENCTDGYDNGFDAGYEEGYAEGLKVEA